jgi:phenylacetate-CoA ligase
MWAGLAVLERDELQATSAELTSAAPPPGHGPVSEVSSSGSTGTPVTVRTTAAAGALWHAITLRDHRWHERNLSFGMWSFGSPSRPSA